MAEAIDQLNEAVMNRLNGSGEVFLSHTKVGGRFVLRVAIGNIRTERRHIEHAWPLLRSAALEAGSQGRVNHTLRAAVAALAAVLLLASGVLAAGVGDATWTPTTSATTATPSHFPVEGDAIDYRTDAARDGRSSTA